MKLTQTILLTCVFLASSQSAVLSASPSVSARTGIAGRVLDKAGAPIANAFIMIYREDAGSPENTAKVVSDADGRFETDLYPGYYDVLIGAREFMPVCKRVEIVNSRVIRFSPKLVPDSEHLQDIH